MIIKHVIRTQLALFFIGINPLLSNYFDNRFIPFHPHSPLQTVQKRSHFGAQIFFLTANSARGDASKEKKGIPEILGSFDQRVLTDASVAAGNANRLRPAWQIATDIKWDVHGKIQGQGFSLFSEYTFGNHITFGGSTAYLHISSNQKFVLPKDTVRSLSLTPSDEQELDQNRRDTLTDLGFTQGKWSKSGMADSELHIRYGWAKEYRLKCRQVLGGVTLGALIPTAAKRDQTNSAAIPFGANHMSGFHCAADASFEIKEDMWASFLVDISKRFKKTQTRRIPLKGESELFGATSGRVKVDPGVTVTFAPQFTYTDIQNGFGASLQYAYTFHARDVWQDKRTITTLPIDISKISDLSRWKSEYLLFNVFYDVSRVSPTHKIAPTISLTWDIPVSMFSSLDYVKTQRVGISIQVLF